MAFCEDAPGVPSSISIPVFVERPSISEYFFNMLVPYPHFCQHLGDGVTLSNTPEQLNVVDEEIIPLSIPAIIVHGL